MRSVNLRDLQEELLRQKQVLIYISDVKESHPQWLALQRAGLAGCFPQLAAKPDGLIDEATAKQWAKKAGRADIPTYEPEKTTRGEFAAVLFNR